MARIAISYRRADSESITGRIFDRLVLRYGKESVFRDIDNIPLGTDFRKYIGEALSKSDILIVVIGPRWIAQGRISDESDPVRIELEIAFQQKINVIPVLVDRARMPKSAQLPASLKDFPFLNAAKIDSGQDFDHHMAGLIRFMDRTLGTEPEVVPKSSTLIGDPNLFSTDGRQTPHDERLINQTARENEPSLESNRTALDEWKNLGDNAEADGKLDPPSDEIEKENVTRSGVELDKRKKKRIAGRMSLILGGLVVCAIAILLYARLRANDPDAFYALGLDAYKQNDAGYAIYNYNKALKIDRNHALAYIGRGEAYRNLKEFDNAIADYTEAIRVDPTNATIYINRATAYRAKGELEIALSDYNEAIRLDPRAAVAYQGRGSVYSDKQDYEKALADYNEALRVDSKYSLAYSERGDVYYAEGNFELALSDYNEAIRLNPKSANAYNGRGKVYLAKRDYDRAIANFNEVLRLDSSYVAAINNRSTAYEEKGQYEQAIQGYDQLVTMQPGVAEWWDNRCWGRAIIGELELALGDCNEALRLQPGDPSALDSRGLVYLKLAQFDKAIADYDAALRRNPKQAASLYGRGIAKIKKGDRSGDADKTLATTINPDIAKNFVRYGVK